MRDRFSELIKKGVASFQEKPVGSPTPTLNPMVTTYNNLWGLLTDTHMSTVDDGYIITGTFVKSPYWERFKYCDYYGTTNIKLGSGFNSLENMVWSYGYMMTPDMYNGDYVIRLIKRPPTDSYPKEQSGSEYVVPCRGVCSPVITSLGESQIPRPFKTYFTDAQSRDICEAWKRAEGNALKIIENLMESSEVDVGCFRISADNQYIIVDEKVKISLN